MSPYRVECEYFAGYIWDMTQLIDRSVVFLHNHKIVDFIEEILEVCPQRLIYAYGVPNKYFSMWLKYNIKHPLFRLLMSKNWIINPTTSQVQIHSKLANKNHPTNLVKFVDLVQIADVEEVRRAFELNQFSVKIPYFAHYDVAFNFN